MQGVESKRSSDHYSELCKNQEEVADEPDFQNISQGNIDRVVFEGKNQERSPFSVNLYCSDDLKLDRPLIVKLINHFAKFSLVTF